MIFHTPNNHCWNPQIVLEQFFTHLTIMIYHKPNNHSWNAQIVLENPQSTAEGKKITSSHSVIISSWSQGNWGLGIKPGRSIGTASHNVLAIVATSVLWRASLPRKLGNVNPHHNHHHCLSITIRSSSVGSRSQASRAEKPYKDVATVACAIWLAIPVELPGFIPRPQFPWDFETR